MLNTKQHTESLATYDNKPEASDVSDSTDYFQLIQCDIDWKFLEKHRAASLFIIIRESQLTTNELNKS